MDYLPYYDSPSWDQCRLQVHAQVSAFSKKRYTPQDILHFPWDDDYKEKVDLPTEITKEEIEKLREKSKKFKV